jgi:hypothetical protein
MVYYVPDMVGPVCLFERSLQRERRGNMSNEFGILGTELDLYKLWSWSVDVSRILVAQIGTSRFSKSDLFAQVLHHGQCRRQAGKENRDIEPARRAF